MFLLMTTMAVLFLTALAAIANVLWKIQTGNSVPVEVLQECSVERYRPMLRLLDESDCEAIIAGFPQHSREVRRRFRAERRSLFRIYLGDLGADHAKIVGAIRLLLVESQIDRPDLAKALYRGQFVFALAMVSIQFKLLLHAWGIGTVDGRSLLASIEGIQLQLQDMVFVRAVGHCQGINQTA